MTSAVTLGKRKRPATTQPKRARSAKPKEPLDDAVPSLLDSSNTHDRSAVPEERTTVHLQIVTGSYDRVLHGIHAQIPPESTQSADDDPPTRSADDGQPNSDPDQKQHHPPQACFTNSFLFAAHASAIRCLAISPPSKGDASKRFLATGGTDERINLYSLSTAVSSSSSAPPPNRSLGSLVHHDRAITRLSFPTKTKLFSAAQDNVLAVTRSRDWTVLSAIKAPIPTPHGRPSGDTAAPGDVPAGINDFAVHPSQKLMLTVGRGEKCMRLWNLMTGKKAGVLAFSRDLLVAVGEPKAGTGDARRVLWSLAGDCFVVAFERAAVVFGIDSQPRALVRPSPATKLHSMTFVSLGGDAGEVLAVGTEDGRVLFFRPVVGDRAAPPVNALPACVCVAHLGGSGAGVGGRVKDFRILDVPPTGAMVVVTGGSDGVVRVWRLRRDELALDAKGEGEESRRVGRLAGMLETGARITCLDAFVLQEAKTGAKRQAGPSVADAAGDATDGASDARSDAEPPAASE